MIKPEEAKKRTAHCEAVIRWQATQLDAGRCINHGTELAKTSKRYCPTCLERMRLRLIGVRARVKAGKVLKEGGAG